MELTKVIRLKHIRDDIVGNCKACILHKGRKNIVFGSGNFGKKILLLGESPGFSEDQQGVPFIGDSGKLLNKWLSHIGVDREIDVYVSNLIQCHPPNNRDPKLEEMEKCTPFLEKKIEVLKPRIIVALGKLASNFITKSNTSISSLRERTDLKYKEIPVICTFHPSFVLRKEGGFSVNGVENSKVLKDLLRIHTYIEK